MLTQNRRLLTIVGTIVFILLAPLIAMQFTTEVKWTPFDFIVAGTLLAIAGLAIEFTIRKVMNSRYRLAICLAILAVFLLTWVELAVGIFGSPIAGS